MIEDPRKAIHEKVVSLAEEIGNDARGLGYGEIIPASGLLNSASIMELIMWVETHFEVDIDQECLTIENFGSVDAIATYLRNTQAADDNQVLGSER